MTELISIKEYKGQKVINARELHYFLESRRDFSTWIKDRIEKYGFIENQDYSTFTKIVERAKRIEYALTIDTAKEIAMVEGNDKGKQARQYFIECEKKLQNKAIDFSNPDTVLQLAQNWAESEKKRLEAEKTIKVLQPKADLMDKVMDTDDKIDIGQAAKILKLPFGRNIMFSKLRENGIFFKNKNEPKQEYIAREYFELKEKFIERNDHPGFVVIKVLVTQKGLDFLSKLFGVVSSHTKQVTIS
jgi:anti-repressor protein